jgi:hypothetical protein
VTSAMTTTFGGGVRRRCSKTKKSHWKAVQCRGGMRYLAHGIEKNVGIGGVRVQAALHRPSRATQHNTKSVQSSSNQLLPWHRLNACLVSSSEANDVLKLATVELLDLG